MRDEDKTKEQLMNELVALRQRITELKASEAERKRVEEALQASETRYRRLFESAKDGILILDADTGQIAAVNPFLIEMLGYSQEELLGKKLWEIGPFKDVAVSKTAFMELQSKGYIRYEDLPLETSDGRLIDVEFVSNAYLANHERVIQCNIRDITKRKQAEEALQQRTAQLEVLREVALELTAQLDLDALLRLVVSRSIELLRGTEGGLYLYRPDRDVLEWAVGIGPNMVPPGAILHQGEGLSGKVWETGEPLIVDDYQHWEGRALTYDEYPFAAVVGVPIHWGKEFLGVLDILADAPRTFSADDADLLSLFATQAAIAIQNARLFKRERKQRELTEALEEAAAVVSGTLDLDQVLDRILERVERVVAGDAFSVMLIADDTARLTRWRGYELPEEEMQPLPFGIPIARYSNLAKMAQTGKPIVVPDTLADPDWVPSTRDQGWRRSYVGAPIQVGDATVGFLNVSGTRLGQFGPGDARRLQAFASHAATAIENARLYGEVQRELAERRRVEEALRESEDKYRQLFESESDAIFLIDNETGHILEVNTAASALYGYSREELLGKKNSDLSAEPGETRRVTQTTPVIADQVVAIPLRFHRKKDGTVFPVEITGRFFIWRGRPVHIAAIRDITERKRAEEERERLILELQEALAKVKTLSGLIPICASCKKIRDDEGFWNQLETYIQEHSEAVFSHGICPECEKKLYPELYGDDE